MARIRRRRDDGRRLGRCEHCAASACCSTARAKASAIPRPGTDASVLLIFNSWHEGVEFVLPPAVDGGKLDPLFDTALETQAARVLRGRRPLRDHRALGGGSRLRWEGSAAAPALRALPGLEG